MGSRLETEVQILREVPSQREIAVPEEFLTEDQRNCLSAQILKVTLLQFIILTTDRRVETDTLWQVVQSKGLGEIEPF